MGALKLQTPACYAAVLVDHDNMAPEIPLGSVAFLAEPGFTGEGIYSLPHEGRHHGDIRRICHQGDHWLVKMDNWPGEPHRLSAGELRDLAPSRVVGVASAYTVEFSQFLRTRFAGHAEGVAS